jgi:hypothetical protein
MQLEQLGNDVLRVMDTPLEINSTETTTYLQKKSPLEGSLKSFNASNPTDPNPELFKQDFLKYANETPQTLYLEALLYRSDDPNPQTFVPPPIGKTEHDHYITVTRWVNLGDEVVLVEVHLWRD